MPPGIQVALAPPGDTSGRCRARDRETTRGGVPPRRRCPSVWSTRAALVGKAAGAAREPATELAGLAQTRGAAILTAGALHIASGRRSVERSPTGTQDGVPAGAIVDDPAGDPLCASVEAHGFFLMELATCSLANS